MPIFKRIGGYIATRAKEGYHTYKEEASQKRAEAKILRAEVLKTRLATRKEQAIRIAKEREIARANRKLIALKSPYTRGYTPLFAKRIPVISKPIKHKKHKKPKRHKKKRYYRVYYK
jgi:hypothetical protein